MLLWFIAQEEVRRDKFSLSPSCETKLKQFITVGEDKVEQGRENPSLTAPHQSVNIDPLTHAVVNTRYFVATMKHEAVREGSFLIQDSVFEKAKNLCPLWPFC
jgi:hypothetical protein